MSEKDPNPSDQPPDEKQPDNAETPPKPRRRRRPATAKGVNAAATVPAEIARQVEERDAAFRAAANAPAVELARQIEARDESLRKMTEGPAAEMARRIASQGAVREVQEGSLAKTARMISELGLQANPVASQTAKRLQELIDQSNKSAGQLRQRAIELRQPVTLPPPAPRPEAEAAWVIQEQLPALVDLQAKTFEQIAAMGTIAQEELAESQLLRGTMAEYTTEAKRTGDRMTWLTVAIAAFTALLLWKDLEIWPFAPWPF